MKWPIVRLFVERWVDPNETLLLAHLEPRTSSFFGRGTIHEPRYQLALTLAIELPAMISTLNVTRAWDASERQGYVSVWTAIEERAGRSFTIAEEHDRDSQNCPRKGLAF
jgi:hypothetical protein